MRRALVLMVAACGARSSLDSATPSRDAAAPDAGDPTSWTFITDGYPSGLALDGHGNPFFTVSGAHATTFYALDGITKSTRWRSELINAGVTAIAYDAGALYVTGVGGPGTHVDVAGIGIDLPPLDSYWSSFIAKLDAANGRAIWAITPDADRTPHVQAFSKCVGIAAGWDGAVAVCGYFGERFGVGGAYLPGGAGLGVLRFANDGRLEWAKALAGDPVGGHVFSWRRAIAFDANGDVWIAGSHDAALVDESSSAIVLPALGMHDEEYPYVLRIQRASRAIGPAATLPFPLTGGETLQDVPSIDVVGNDVFASGDTGERFFYGMLLDARTLDTRWQQSGTASNARAVADGSGGMLLGLATTFTSRIAELVHIDAAGAIANRNTIATTSCATVDGCKSGSGWSANVEEVRFDRAQHAVYLLGVTSGRAVFDDGTMAESPQDASSTAVASLARRTGF